jgi:CMP-N-acetylneuraminic acid synthetase
MSSLQQKVVALVPLRGGSKSIPKKNIKNIAGKPLCAWVLEAARLSKFIDEVYVSTDSEEIIRVVKEIDASIHIVKRPQHLSDDLSSTESVMLHFMDNVDFDILVTIQATSPLTQSSDIDNALLEFKTSRKDSLLTAVESKRFFWNYKCDPINYNPINRPRRQDFQGFLMENGAFYITSREVLSREKCRLGGNIGIYIMDDESSFEIDEPLDWDMVELILNKKFREKPKTHDKE